MSLQLIKIVKAVDAVKRRPVKAPANITFFSEEDVWVFQEVIDTKVCEICRTAARIEQFRGNNLRMNFPYLVILNMNEIGGGELDGNGLVHPNCRCRLVRVLYEYPKVSREE